MSKELAKNTIRRMLKTVFTRHGSSISIFMPSVKREKDIHNSYSASQYYGSASHGSRA